MKSLLAILVCFFYSFLCYCQPKAKSFNIGGTARFQSVYDDDLNTYTQWAAFPKIGYSLSDFFVIGLQVSYRNEELRTALENELFPNYYSQQLKDLGLGFSSRLYINPYNDFINWFVEFEYLFAVRHGEFDPPF